MTKQHFISTFFVAFCLLSAVKAQEIAPELPAERPTLPPATPVSPFLLQDGEILLTGKITGVNVARAALSIFADSFTVPNGKSKAIDPPRPKSIVLAAPGTIFNPPGANSPSEHGFSLSALRRGDDIALIGRESPNGQPFAARVAYLRAPLSGLLTERARAGFKTKLIENKYQPDGPAPAAEGFQIVKYPSPAGELSAYLSNDPGDGKKHPAVLWAHGGFGGIGASTAEQAKPFIEAGCIVMCPSWRGENDNPGQFELFGGEVEDAVAALNYLKQLPFVDAERIYMAGHSTGGTMTLLTAASTPLLRAAFSLGGAPDIANVLRNGGYENMPFDKSNPAEVRFRSPGEWISLMRAPVYYFEGEKSFYVADAKWMEAAAQRQGVDLRAYIIQRNDHFTIVKPVIKAIAQKIQNDTGAAPNITFSADEIKALFPPDAPLSITK